MFNIQKKVDDRQHFLYSYLLNKCLCRQYLPYYKLHHVFFTHEACLQQLKYDTLLLAVTSLPCSLEREIDLSQIRCIYVLTNYLSFPNIFQDIQTLKTNHFSTISVNSAYISLITISSIQELNFKHPFLSVEQIVIGIFIPNFTFQGNQFRLCVIKISFLKNNSYFGGSLFVHVKEQLLSFTSRFYINIVNSYFQVSTKN